MAFGEVSNGTNHDCAIGARDVCMEVWTIGGVPCLRLEILLLLVDHDESVVMQQILMFDTRNCLIEYVGVVSLNFCLNV